MSDEWTTDDYIQDVNDSMRDNSNYLRSEFYGDNDYDDEWYEDYPDYTDFDLATDTTFVDIWKLDRPGVPVKVKLTLYRVAFFIRGWYRIARYRLSKWWFFVRTGRDLDKELPF